MEAYGKILLIAMPAFLGLVLFEKWWGWRKGNIWRYALVMAVDAQLMLSPALLIGQGINHAEANPDNGFYQ